MKKLLSITLALVFCCFTCFAALAPSPVFGASEAERPASAEISHRGMDASKWQGAINFREVRRSGIRVVYIKAGEGDHSVDPYFRRNYRLARQSRMHIGLYHYVTARTVSQARRQAHFFASLINEKNIHCRPAMDFEQVSGLTKVQANHIALAYVRELHRLTGYRPAVYSDDYDARTLWGKALTRYPLWIADYGKSAPSDLGPWERWEGFQYTDKGRVSGVSGLVDLDRFRSGMYLNTWERYRQRPVVHHVKKGENLQRIARKYKTTELSIVQLNRIEYPFAIHAGQRLIIKAGNRQDT